MARSKTSQRWLDEHFSDPYVQKAKAEGLRSRAAYKLLEIQQKDKLLRSGMTVIDLGAAPGSWSVIAKQLVGDKGKVFALDILAMDPIAGVEFIQGDFTEQTVLDTLMKALDGEQVDLVISDMAPNTSGIKAVDQPRAMYLVTLAWELSKEVLKPGGSFLVKVFQGAGFDEFLVEMRKNFKKVVIRKPKASRSRSKEAYLLAKDYNI